MEKDCVQSLELLSFRRLHSSPSSHLNHAGTPLGCLLPEIPRRSASPSRVSTACRPNLRPPCCGRSVATGEPDLKCLPTSEASKTLLRTFCPRSSRSSFQPDAEICVLGQLAPFTPGDFIVWAFLPKHQTINCRSQTPLDNVLRLKQEAVHLALHLTLPTSSLQSPNTP